MDTLLVMPATNEEYRPEIKKWQLYFLKKYGSENCTKVIKKFVAFYTNKEGDELIFSEDEHCSIIGLDGHLDGTIITTSQIKSIKRITCAAEGAPRDIMCVSTTTEHKYYVYSDEYSKGMCIMMGDMMFVGKLRDESRCYQYDESLDV